MDMLSSSSPPKSPNSRNLKIRRVEFLDSTGLLAERKFPDENSTIAEHVISDEKSTTAEDELSQSIQPQQIEQQQKDDDELARKAHMLTMKEIMFSSHPDILRVIKKKELGPDGKKRYLFNYGSEDIDSDDEELIHVPTEFKWLGICLEKWHDDDLVSRVRAGECDFEIYTAGFRSEDGVRFGCGAMIRDSCHRPIIASSKVISDGKCVSQFRLELEGVALGVKLAKKYKVFPFYIFCPSEEVSFFVQRSEAQKRNCHCSGERKLVESPCGTCSKKLMLPEDHKDREEASKIIKDIFSEISELEGMGLPWFSVMSGGSESAYSVAKLQKDEELNIKEIGALKDLWATIYEEVFGQYVKLP